MTGIRGSADRRQSGCPRGHRQVVGDVGECPGAAPVGDRGPAQRPEESVMGFGDRQREELGRNAQGAGHPVQRVGAGPGDAGLELADRGWCHAQPRGEVGLAPFLELPGQAQPLWFECRGVHALLVPVAHQVRRSLIVLDHCPGIGYRHVTKLLLLLSNLTKLMRKNKVPPDVLLMRPGRAGAAPAVHEANGGLRLPAVRAHSQRKDG